MAVDRRQANLKTLEETKQVQDKTKEAVIRIQQQVAETEELAITTLEELRKQGHQMDEVNSDLEQVNAKLDQSQQLQNKFDVWAGNWFGGKKRAALNEASAEISARSREEYGSIKEIFENEKYDSFARIWKPNGLVLCTNPGVDAPQLFDPKEQAKVVDSPWVIDFSLGNLDAEGWTYGKDLNSLNNRGTGEPAAKWNFYVRRRKWKFFDRKVHHSQLLDGVRDRNDQRNKDKHSTLASSASGGALGQVEKLGYVPRTRPSPSPLLATSLQSNSIAPGAQRRDDDQALDEESAAGLSKVKKADLEIDQGLNAIGHSIDKLGRIAGDMKDETIAQTSKLDKLDNNMQRAAEKQAIVNARQRKLLQSS